jgi:hypothetical protein
VMRMRWPLSSAGLRKPPPAVGWLNIDTVCLLGWCAVSRAAGLPCGVCVLAAGAVRRSW